ncbi:helix-turn-helix domain-containing protein [Actinoplanes regularis]|uniref:Uncharacterized protein n=1 Tax=Actinoplanes regularis TaxID=52697 RepID=A0A239EE82_9ACTN|nr:helix-turn-helix domain-containing protein [Actinoplanes regularis]GIE89179.1 hypothetical protein Are01nite_56590 [Actinoplanes regularis]SNS42956.1 hypothetical protein SAMN06264365_115135 [Actinoplanes regularis]
MVIGIVVHSGQRGCFAEAARTLTGVSFAWAVYEREAEIRDRVGDLLATGTLDGLLLGPVPHARARDLLPPGLPVVITRSAALDLALAWARARGNGWPATPVSIDTFPDETVTEVAAALGLDRAAIATLPFRPEQPVGEVVEFHREHLERTGATYVITVRTEVAAALDGRTAVLPAMATPGTIRADLHDLVSRVRSQQADEQRFAAAVFRAPEPGAREALRQALSELPELADAWIDEHGPRGVIAFAPAGVFETLTQHWVSLPLGEMSGFHGTRSPAANSAASGRPPSPEETGTTTAESPSPAVDGTRAAGSSPAVDETTVAEPPNLAEGGAAFRDEAGLADQRATADGAAGPGTPRGRGPAAGFGIGASARSSVALAEQAADRAERDGSTIGYLITEDGMMIGPIGAAGPPLAYTYREHGGLEELAVRAGLSAATMSRLAALERSLAGRPISPGELARALGITDPSGRRLIRKLGEAGLVAADGSAQPHHKGRPTRLYRLAIRAALAPGGDR